MAHLLVTSAQTLTGKALSVVSLYIVPDQALQVLAATTPDLPLELTFATVSAMDTWGKHHFAALNDGPKKKGPAASASKIQAHTLPLIAQEKTLGVLGVYTPRTLTAAQKHWLKLLVASLAGAIHAAQLSNQITANQQVLDRAAALDNGFHRYKELIAQNIPPHTLAERLLIILHSVVSFDSAVLYKQERTTYLSALGANQGGQSLTGKSFQGMTYKTLPMLHQLLTTRKPIYVQNVKQNQLWRPHLPDHTQGSWCGIPLLHRNHLVGLLAVGKNQPDFFTPTIQSILEMFGGSFALSIHNIILAEYRGHETLQMSALAQKVISAQEDERKRVSRELHDEAGQSLTALSMNLEMLQDDLAGQSQKLIDRARESVSMTRQTLERLSQLARQMRPPALDTLGLIGALEQLCKDVQRRTGLEIILTTQQVNAPPDSMSLTLYRFVQEALTNVNKHAQATKACVTIEQIDGELRITVHDDGKGFDQNQQLKGPRRSGQLGLLGMRERLTLINGLLEIHSILGDGTLLIAHIPLPSESSAP